MSKNLRKEDELLKKWCKRDDIDYKLTKALKEKIFPLLENAHGKRGDTFDRVLCEQKKGTDLRLENSARLLKILRSKLDLTKFSRDEFMALGLHNEFMVLVEGFFATQINFLIFILIANGHDFYSNRRGKYVKTFNEIEEADLAFKMKFLEEHNFDELGKNERRIRILRNSVAHVFYEIEPTGNMRIGKETISPKQYEEYYDYLRTCAFAVQNIQNLYYLKLVASLSTQDWARIENVTLEQVKCSCGYVNLLPTDRTNFRHDYKCTKCRRPLV